MNAAHHGNFLIKQLLLFTLLLAPLAGCTKEPQSPLRIGTNVWPGYEPLYLARELGLCKENSIKLVEYPSSTETMRSFQNATIDAAALTLDETMQLLASGADIKVILVMDVSQGADVLLARPEIKSMSELRNRRVGLESTALGAYMLTRALQSAGMKPTDVKTVLLEEAEHESGYRDGRIDAVVTFDPVRTRLLAAGARQIFDSSMIPGEIVDLLVVRGSFAKNNPGQVKKLLQCWFRALDYLERDRPKAAGTMAVREKMSAAEFLASLKGMRFPDLKENRLMLDKESPALLPSAERLATVMFENRLIPLLPDLRPVLDGKYLPETGP